ncbi:hypothetical protein [Streptomyces sp. NPDC048659]|uniref:hypothetical protein n=1 Tax=Streptomyces sp. NPDC048659 TaxID=3155489 RepID=UPI0034398C52
MDEDRVRPGAGGAWTVAAAVAAGVAALLGLVIGPLLGALFVISALAAVPPLLLRGHPKARARASLGLGVGLLAWSLTGAVIGMFLFLPAALLLIVAAFADRRHRPGALLAVLAPLAAAAVLVLNLTPGEDPGQEPPPYFRATLDSMDRGRDQRFQEGVDRLWYYGATRTEVYELAGRLMLDVEMPRDFTGRDTEEGLRRGVTVLPGVVDVRRCTFHTC